MTSPPCPHCRTGCPRCAGHRAAASDLWERRREAEALLREHGGGLDLRRIQGLVELVMGAIYHGEQKRLRAVQESAAACGLAERMERLEVE